MLLSGNEWPGVQKKPGVYRIRAFHHRGKPIRVPRALGIDYEGVIDIGESDNLIKRLSYFWGRATGKSYSHSAADEYISWEMRRHWPLELLRFDFIHVDDKTAAEKLELKMIDEYRARFYDRPPLNKSQGKRGKHA